VLRAIIHPLLHLVDKTTYYNIFILILHLPSIHLRACENKLEVTKQTLHAHAREKDKELIDFV